MIQCNPSTSRLMIRPKSTPPPTDPSLPSFSSFPSVDAPLQFTVHEPVGGYQGAALSVSMFCSTFTSRLSIATVVCALFEFREECQAAVSLNVTAERGAQVTSQNQYSPPQ